MSPAAPRKPCRSPGCSTLGTTTYCEKHTIKKEAEVKAERIKYDKERGTSSSRGYTYRWSKAAKIYLKNNPLCAMCEKEGHLELAQCVDHIEAVDGPDDPKFWDESNWQSLSLRCHSIKTAKEDGALGNVKRKDRFL